ncbi:diguanylate cyclase [Desulfotomaculum nigrificans CO-1-SRB]|uniref:Diguanylate cyclase n=1 Tax=Desulfotomaculum nigrificans (strain DSM 14880 / VKM B-2319 / CO-1-SRB) TaxID=868595 RepID=F6B7G7_DESCC|nr:diguanylate cyclase [Desulfotomaculum nigrificans CO-1-SRB]
MGLTEKTLNQLHMANLRLKILLVVVVCGALLMLTNLLGLGIFTKETFLTAHTIIEFFCVFVALCIFTVTWYSYLNNCSYYSYFIGLGLMMVGFMDLLHFISYDGMPGLFVASDANTATLYHIMGRFIMACTFFISVFLYKKEFCSNGRLRYLLLIISLALVSLIIATVTLAPNLYPLMYIKGHGLTQAKVVAEYLIIFLMFLGISGYLFLYQKKPDSYLELIICTLIICIFSELCYTSYESVYDSRNLLGHIFRFAAYVVLYLAIFVNNVKRPYLQLVEAREELAKANALLEEKVRQRTQDLQQANEKLAQAATVDFLTGAINRREFSRLFAELLAKNEPQAVHSVMALDFDSFKTINDTFGHAIGDECLKTFVQAAKDVIRPTDSVSRFGGDEFVLLLPYTPRAGAKIVAEKIRNRLKVIANPPFTISIGVAEWPKDGMTEKDLLASADQALYMAKEKGKNRVE